MVQRVLILMGAMHVFVLMDGRETIAVKILTIVLMLLALMVQHVSMALEILRVVAHRERLDYYVIWTMHVLLIPVIKMQSVRRAQLMVHLHAHALKDSLDQIVLRISTNVTLDRHASIMAFV